MENLKDVNTLEDFLDYIYGHYGYEKTIGFMAYFLGIGWTGENGPEMVKRAFELYKEDKLDEMDGKSNIKPEESKREKTE